MSVRDIVRKAWQVTQVHLKKLIWYGFVPAFFTTIVSSTYLTYQFYAFKGSALFSNEDRGAGIIKDIQIGWDLITTYPKFTIILIVIGAIIFGGYTLTPPVFRATLIHALIKIKNFEPITGSVEVGVRKFFPMFEYGLVVGSFSIVTVFTESSFILRWWGENVFFMALPILLFIAAVGLIASYLSTYSEYFIVINGMGIVKSIMESAVLVIANLRKTFLVFLLMMLISARAILNVILVLCIPMGVVVIGGYLATIFFQTIGLIVISVLGLAVLIVASYLMGLFNVFSTAVWVFTYAELTKKGE